MNGMSPHGAAGLGKLTPGQCAALVRQLLGEPDAEYSEDGVLRFNELLVSPAKGIYLDRRAGKRGTILELIGAKLGISTRDGQVEYVNKWVLETQHVEPIVRSANGAAGPIVAGMFGVPRGVPPLTAEEVEALEADQRVSASTDGLDGPDQALPDPVPPAEATDAPDMPPAAPAVAAGELPAAGDLGVLPGSDATPPGAAAPARSTPPVPPAGPAPAVLGSGSTASRVEPAAARQANGHAENVQLRGKRINDPLLVDVPAKLLKAEQLPHQTEPGAAKGARQMLDRRAVQTFTAEALQTMTFPPLNFILPGLVPEGATLLVSRPKLGKSWLVLDLALATAAGRFTLGELKPASGDVLYLALEDGPRRLQRRLTRLIPTFSGVWPPGLTMATEWPRGEQGIAEIAKWIAAAKTPRLIIVDTLAQFRAASTGKQQIYTDDYAAI